MAARSTAITIIEKAHQGKQKPVMKMTGFHIVRERGLEPPRLTAHEPQSCVFTNYTTRAFIRQGQAIPIHHDWPTIANIRFIFNFLREREIPPPEYIARIIFKDSSFAYFS